MGFINFNAKIELKAKLTPEGRKRIIEGNNEIITFFSLGDSDANYNTFTGLTGNQVPAISGNGSGNERFNGGNNYKVNGKLRYDLTNLIKPVEPNSSVVSINRENIGYGTVNFSGGTITQNKINLDDTSTDSLTNLFTSFNLPISSREFNKFTGETSNIGGFSDTSLSGLAQTKILVIGIDNDSYGEIIDGKTIRLILTTSANTYNIYCTYEDKGIRLTSEDSAIYDTAVNLNQFGTNTALLFSDEIARPNYDISKSWSTGYSTNKPFSLNKKILYNRVNNFGSAISADTTIGIAFLDKGFLVITHPDIVNSYDDSFSGSSATTVTFDSVRNVVTQSFTCMANRNEFTTSTNKTWSTGDIPRITEVILYDNTETAIAIGKLTTTYYKAANDFVAFNVKLLY